MEHLFLLCIRKMLMMHMALFVAPTGVGKTHLALDLLEQEYLDHFNFIVILCSTLQYNEIYHRGKWFWTDPHIILIEPDNCPYDYIKKIGNILAGSKTLFLINNIIANEALDEQRQLLLDLAISGWHKGHLLWLLTQSYIAVPLNIRRQAKRVYVWYPKTSSRLGYYL